MFFPYPGHGYQVMLLKSVDLVTRKWGSFIMADKSAIEWTDATWNPVRGCTKISPGCKFCYAERFAERFRGVPAHAYEQGFDLRLAPDKLAQPLRWRVPRMIFVNSMSDLFHKEVPREYISKVFTTMEKADWHIYQVLTKRSSLMQKFINERYRKEKAPLHMWFGVSVENARAVSRLTHLRNTNARIRFLSIEPLIAPVGKLNLKGIDWVITGGESGPGARPMDPKWVINIRNQCVKAKVAFFFKQWGGVRKKKAGRTLDGRTWDEMPVTQPLIAA